MSIFRRRKKPEITQRRRIQYQEMRTALQDRDSIYSIEAYRDVFRYTHDMVVMLNPSLEIIDTNPRTERVLGKPSARLAGRKITEFAGGGATGGAGANLPGDPRFRAILEDAARGRSGVHTTRLVVGDAELPVRMTALPLRAGEARTGVLLVLQDLSEEEKSEDSLKQAVSYLQNIFYNSPDPIFMVEVNGKIVEYNGAAAGLTGRSSTKAEGSLFTSMFPSPQEVKQLFGRARSRPVLNVESVLRRSDGKSVPVNLSAALIRDENEKPAGFVVVCHDMTYQKKAQEKIRRQNIDLKRQTAKAMEANRLKSEFLANMSHELRTPLNAVLALSQVILDEPKDCIPETHRDKLRVIKNSGETLLHLINGILDLAKIEAGRMSVNPEPVNVKYITHSVVETIAPLSEEKSITLDERYSSDLPKAVFTDEGSLQQVLMNIAGNAVKFTEEGVIRVSVEMLQYYRFPEKSLLGSPGIAFSIADTGIGISAEHLRSMFQEFRQVDGTATRKYGGTGLGLAIFRRLIRMLHGIIEVGSKPGQGTEFRVIIPMLRSAKVWEKLEPVSEIDDTQRRDVIRIIPYRGEGLRRDRASLRKEVSKKAPGARGADRDDKTRRVVLVVDDNESNRYVVKALLEKTGVEIVEAASGREGLDKANSARPDLIFMDIMMPGMDGMEATQRLKKGRLASIPVVALTAKVMKEDVEAAMKAGFDDFLPKPVEREKFNAIMEKWLEVES